MKIALLVPTFPPKWLAGTQIATYNIAKYLARKGHEVHVITSLDEGLPKENMENGFYIHRIPYRKIQFLGIVSFWVKIFLMVRKIDPDVVQTQGIGNGIPGFLASVFLKKPSVVYGRGSDIYTNYQYKNTIVKLTLKNANAIIALTEDMNREISKIYCRECFVIPNGISIDDYCENQPNKICYGNNEKIILYVGSLRPIKGIKYLIEAMKITSQNCPNTRLLIVGDGEEQKILKNLVDKLDINQHITFVGRISNEDVLKYMASSDVFVLPSLSEGLPNVILEAMASGLPIVATKIRGLPEIICEGINGYLVEPKNSGDIAEKIIYLMNNIEVMQSMSENNIRDVKQYAWENVIKRLEDVYSACI